MLSPAQKRLRDLKSRISAQSKKNFVLERDVRYLDSRIALLIQNRMGGEEVSLVRVDVSTGGGRQEADVAFVVSFVREDRRARLQRRWMMRRRKIFPTRMRRR